MNQRTDDIFRKRLLDAAQAYPDGLWEQIAPHIPEYPAGKARRRRPVVLFTAMGILLALAFWFGENALDRGETSAPLHQTADFEMKDLGASANPFDEETANNPREMIEPSGNLPEERTVKTDVSNTSSRQVHASQPVVPQSSKQIAELNGGAGNTVSPIPAPAGKTIIPASKEDSRAAVRSSMKTENHIQLPGSTRSKKRFPAVSQLISGSPYLANLPGDEDRFEIDGIGPDPDCYSFGRRHQSNFTIDVYTGLGIAMRPMNSADEDVSNYIDARQDTESFRYLFTLGARINMMMNSGLAFRGGLHYTQIGEKFDYTDTSAVRIITIIDTTFVGGDTIVNTSQEVQEGTLIKKINNRFHSIDIPLLIGYDVPLGRLQASLSAGPVINISAWQRGQFLSPSLEPVFIETDAPDYYPAYRTSLGIGIYLSAALAVPVTENMWLFGEPYMLHRLNPVTLDDYSIRQRNTNVGLNVGLKLKI